MKYFLGLIAALVALLVVWGVAIEPRFVDVQTETATIPNLPRQWEGKRVALFADMQVGMWFGNTDTVERIVRRLVDERPALILIAGDFVYRPSEGNREDAENEGLAEQNERIGTAVELVRPLVKAGLRVVAVLGNHDYGMMTPEDRKNEIMAKALARALLDLGVQVLENQAVELPLADVDGQTGSTRESSKEPRLYVVGVGSRFANNDHAAKALVGVPHEAGRIVLMHNPDTFDDVPAETAPFAVAAHTHGGQVRLPFLPQWTWLNWVKHRQVHADGWIHDYGKAGNRLYVNRGIGFSYVPLRINCPPELTIFTLVAGPASAAR